ncbi:MAG TPA: hypothetical protein VMK65_08850 [Longimicrobiales bacterium]|nr:hypothetical protein [Longimicrobiales bacterium]
MKLICLALLSLLLVPVDADAQRHRRERAPERDFSMEPYAGVYFDPVVQSGHQAGALVGVRVGYDLTRRMRLLADFGYSEVNGAGLVSSDEDAATLFTYGNDWIFTLAGVEFVLVPGNTAGALTLVGGVGWRGTEIEQRATGAAAEPDLGGWGSYAVIAPGVTLSHGLGARSAVRVSLQDFIVDFGENAEHAPALTLGVSFR